MDLLLSRSRRIAAESEASPLIQLNDLTPEILAQVFDFATLLDSSTFPNQTRTLELCTVCSLWRSVVFTHPRFWAYLHISIRGTTRATDRNSVISGRLVAHFERWFSRAGDLQLELHIDFGEGRLFEPTVIFHEYLVRNSKWRLLRFKGILSAPLQALLGAASQSSKQQPCWPNLRHFIIENSRVSRGTASGYPISLNHDGSGGGASVTSLQRIAPTLQNCSLVSTLTQSPFSYLPQYPYASLTSFQTDGLEIYVNYASSFITFLLAITANLKCLHIRFLAPWKVCGNDASQPTTWVTRVVRHENLEELRLDDFYYQEGESGFTLFGYLQLPRLRVLDISISRWDNRVVIQPAGLDTPVSSILVPFIRESHCELVYLRLRHFSTSRDDLMRVLAQIGPTLKTLELEHTAERSGGEVWRLSTDWGARFLVSLMDARKSGQSILPELETFSFV